ncbi:hypothetical protein GALMADRAFT_129137 [Galerina marginata CBS 339.88]|uniref:Uncharacterized protein n=1 Tax=Galerina marginata (strain CBS 339.88) TaxID=685588 RepID=A0A067SM40_GALM3|nr:hypothetical protein GALMADRAFT_129137 [Galerina marginata CBS 339.88]
MPSSLTLNDLLPELFPIIASHLPLHATPSTLLSLALVNQHVSEITLPLVYSRLILKSEEDALRVIQKLLANAELGLAVREMHIICNLSIETRNGENPFDVVTGLKKVIEAGSLPYIHTLGLHLLSGWHYDHEFKPVDGFGQLRADFWTSLRAKCPRLKGLVLRNIGDTKQDPWLDESGLYEIEGISSFTLDLPMHSGSDVGFDKLLENINTLSPSLHTLSLTHNADWYNASLIFPINFLCLRSLTLSSYVVLNVSEAMEFWNRHPTLEYLELPRRRSGNCWFSSNISADFLPNLRYLKAEYNDIRVLAPILHRLTGLAIYQSINAQVPYLLRSVLPNGLPGLKSLYIGQLPSASGKNNKVDGALWYETYDGIFKENKVQKAKIDIFHNFIHSIVRGAPNLEELGMQGYLSEPSFFENLALQLAPFNQLQRLYCEVFNPDFDQVEPKEREMFLQGSRTLANACKSLRLVTNTDSPNLPYMTATIRRTDAGEVDNLVIGKGYGMQIGSEDEAFPVFCKS